MPNITRIIPTLSADQIDVETKLNIPVHGDISQKITAMDTTASENYTVLDGKVSQEVLDRSMADSAEQSARISADAAEQSAREAKDTELDGKIATETSERKADVATLTSDLATLSATVVAGVDWKSPLEDIPALQAAYATDPIGSVRLVKSTKDAYIKVAPGAGEDLTAEGLAGEAANSYVRFIDSSEVGAGIASLESKIQEEKTARIAGDAEEKAARETAVWQVDTRVSYLHKTYITSLEYVSGSDYSTWLQSNIGIQYAGWGIGLDVTLFITNPGGVANGVAFDNGISLRIPAGENVFKFVQKPSGVWFHV